VAKRLSETKIWGEQWHRELPLEYKSFWKYLCDNCDLIGVWAKDLALASFQIGAQIDENKALELYNKEKERVIVLNEGSKWFLPQFVGFQYGELTSKSPIHLKVLELLNKQGLLKKIDNRVSIGYTIPCKEKEKKKNKDKDNNKGGIRGEIPPALMDVAAYCQERKNGVDPDKWFNHYQAKGWMIGKNKMKDWRAAVRTWEEKGKVKPEIKQEYQAPPDPIEHAKVAELIHKTAAQMNGGQYQRKQKI